MNGSLFLDDDSQELVLKVAKRGRFYAAICVTTQRYDSCAQGG